ncbi:murein DD-endopeptidase MepM/ murein hydrolase activator NlpD [Spirilliplanes yamanashiensis]|nr:M23 family metallopeptidase [Spirilliplanes yamanashiensis]MDP9818507.1 murein DD-endopeptidase MepM/ murein hydrolase activator NlpD [Spirilliplanes yamanashiensis]
MKLRAVLLAVLTLPAVMTAGIAVTAAAAGALERSTCSSPVPPTASGESSPGLQQLSAVKRSNARAIYTVGVQLGVPYRGEVIAIATALQESSLINKAVATDHDSLGLFQQRPSQGWGTAAQILDPVYASTAFYRRLRAVNGWERMPLTEAAQAVQRSKYPAAYAKWEPLATALAADAAAATGKIVLTGACQPVCPPSGDDEARPTCEWVAPVQAGIVSGFRTSARPGHDGVDLGAARATPIRVASAGSVIIVRCDIEPASYGCNRDGSPATPGCGWYVDVEHTDDIITRYCHMLVQPTVAVGQRVAAGQIIGYVGSSGHSSGPHLHFEVHLAGDRSAAGAVDPVIFMAQRGVDLSKGEG